MKPTRARALLLGWYDRCRRDLPWRRGGSPYSTWVSEIMLQQTTVAAALPRFSRFLERFPDVAALAGAPQEDVLKEWAGLGYYSRARNLHAAARAIVSSGGVFPSDLAGIRALPGVGSYTAGAIGSIAFSLPVAAVDGNVRRVLGRLFALSGAAAAPKPLEELAQFLVDPKRPGDWNQALMDLGATLCVPEGPACGPCPLAEICIAKKRGLQDRLPEPVKRRAAVEVSLTCLWVEQGANVLLWKRSQQERFLKGLWGFPEKRHVRARLGPAIKKLTHVITHHKIAVEIKRAALLAAPGPEAAWVDKAKLREYLVSSLWLKCL